MKRKLSMAVLIISIITFTGCAAMIPVHPAKPDSEYYIDKKDCEKNAREYAIGGREDDFSIIDEINFAQRCMREKGWTYKKKEKNSK